MIHVLLADGSEDECDGTAWSVTSEYGLKVVNVDGNDSTIVAEYHPRFWVRVHQGAVTRAGLESHDADRAESPRHGDGFSDG